MEGNKFIKIKHYKSNEIFDVDQFWLRDHCRCSICYNQLTKQRRYNLLDLQQNVKPLRINYIEEDTVLEVKWSDNHHSHYDINFLYFTQLKQTKLRAQTNHLNTPWNHSIILQNEHHLHFSLPKLISSDNGEVKSLLSSLIRYGLVFIDDVPPTTAMTEMAIRRIFPIMKTFFGEMYTFSDQATDDHSDTAYTKEFIGLHTDNTYFCDAAGLQALHCLNHINGSGGENFFIDGLYAVMELKRLYPLAYEILTKVQIPSEYIENGQYHKYTAPMIKIDPVTGEFIQLRLNLYDRSAFNTIEQKNMSEFYDSLRKFLTIVNDIKNRWTLKLKSGTIVIFDNWRICHARHEYTGERTMTGCYVQRTDYLSKARIEGIID